MIVQFSGAWQGETTDTCYNYISQHRTAIVNITSSMVPLAK